MVRQRAVAIVITNHQEELDKAYWQEYEKTLNQELKKAGYANSQDNKDQRTREA